MVVEILVHFGASSSVVVSLAQLSRNYCPPIPCQCGEVAASEGRQNVAQRDAAGHGHHS